jgi:hypothetical protein
MWKGGSPSELGLTVTASLSANSGTLNLNIAAQDWQNAFGVSGLRIGSLGGTIGISEYVTVSLSANGVQLPAAWGPAIGLAPGATLSMNENLNPTQPVLNFSVTPNSNGVALTPLAVGYAGQIAAGRPLTPDQQNIVNSLQISEASFYLAPLGGTTAAGKAIQPGIAVAFQATVDNVGANVVAGIDVSTPSLTADSTVDGFPLGPISLGGAHLLLTVNPSKVEVKFNGSFLYGDYTLDGDVSLRLASTASGAQVSFKVKAGLPYYMTISAALEGTVSGDGRGASVNASAWAGFRINGSLFGSIRMSLNLPGGVSFTDNDDLYTLVMLFKNAGASITLIMVALEKVGYSSFAIFNVLSQLGTYGQSVLDTFFSQQYYDIWVQTPAGQLLVADVAGQSTSPGAPVITYSWNGGYNQDWQFVPYPYYPAGWYEVVNRHSGLCLSTSGGSGYPGTSLVQYPCGGTLSQLWNIGGSPRLNAWLNFITMAQPGYFRVMDVQDGYPWPSGTLDIWPLTGNWNQRFYLTNSIN